MKKIFITRTPAQTKKIGRNLAKGLFKYKKGPFIFALFGPLGSGKTTFLKGFAQGLKIKKEIASPTFIIFKKFKTKNSFSFFHIDCYRIKNEKEILALGFEKIIKNPKNIVAIEWAEKIKNVLPKQKFSIRFKYLNPSKREINISFPSFKHSKKN